MECITDFNFDNYFAALLTPIELTEVDTFGEREKLPPISTISTLGSSSGSSKNLFSSTNNHTLLAESIYMKPLKQEESLSASLNGSSIEDSLLQEDRVLRDIEMNAVNIVPEKAVTERVASVPESPVSNLTEEEVINSPAPLKIETLNFQSSKTAPKPVTNVETKKAAKTKRSRVIAEAISDEAAKKKRRTNYCFEIHRVYCPHSKSQKYFCNVTLSGKLQETVDLIQGKRGKFAYIFYDARKQRHERRYWPSQSCGPVLEDNCTCEKCDTPKTKKPKSSRKQVSRKLAIKEEPKEEPKEEVVISQTVTIQDTSAKDTTNDDNGVIFLEEVILEM